MGLQAVKLQLAVSAICKHEGAVLWSWQKDTEGAEEHWNIERETKGEVKRGCGMMGC